MHFSLDYHSNYYVHAFRHYEEQVPLIVWGDVPAGSCPVTARIWEIAITKKNQYKIQQILKYRKISEKCEEKGRVVSYINMSKKRITWEFN